MSRRGNLPEGRERFLSFEEARTFVRSLDLKDHSQWVLYSQGRLSGFAKKPETIPANPRAVYRSSWKGYPDWLGVERWSFTQARAFVHQLGLRTRSDWTRYCQGKIDGLPPRPRQLPWSPELQYPGEFTSFGDWLGNPEYASRASRMPYDEARKLVSSLGLRSIREWQQYRRGLRPDLPPVPGNIPMIPNVAYKKQWQGWQAWLGEAARVRKVDWCNRVPKRGRRFLPFEEARAFVRSLGIRTSRDWHQYCSGKLPGFPPKPDYLPSCPFQKYKTQWKGYSDWLGTSAAVLPFPARSGRAA